MHTLRAEMCKKGATVTPLLLLLLLLAAWCDWRSSAQAAFETARAEARGHEAAVEEHKAALATKDAQLNALRQQVSGLKQSVEQELDGAMRESAHREALAEKRLLAAHLEINGLKAGIAAAKRVAEQRVRKPLSVACSVLVVWRA